MNKSRIEWCDHTWNPITGCRHGCEYCYARSHVIRFTGDVRLNRMAKDDYDMVPAADGGEDLYILDTPMLDETGNPLIYPFGFEPTYHRYRTDKLDKLKMGNNIFVGAMSDIFGAWVPEQWITDVLEACKERPQHNYMFLTKNPKRYNELDVPLTSNMWYGTSITRESEMRRIKCLPAYNSIFVSFEPLLEDLCPELHVEIFKRLGWVIIGAQTGRRKDKIVPKAEWIDKLVRQADMAGLPVFMKDSLVQIVGEENMRRDFPEELQRRTVSKKMQNKLYAECSRCRENQKKSKMVALLARFRRGERPKQYGFMCIDCFGKACEDMGIDMSDMTEGNANE